MRKKLFFTIPQDTPEEDQRHTDTCIKAQEAILEVYENDDLTLFLSVVSVLLANTAWNSGRPAEVMQRVYSQVMGCLQAAEDKHPETFPISVDISGLTKQ